MIHLRLIVPSPLIEPVLGKLEADPGVAHVMRIPGGALAPAGDVIRCDVARESSNRLIEWLQDEGLHKSGSITIELPDAVVSDAAAAADKRAPGSGADALIWEQVEAKVRTETTPNASYFVFMVIATIIALVAILLDSPILMVGAMVVGPDYGPIAATCVALARRRTTPAWRAFSTLWVGLGVGAVASVFAALLLHFSGLGPSEYDITERQLTAFISQPDGLAVVVAVLAGVVGMLSLTESREGALIGVLVSATTIPAAANMGAAGAYAEWDEFWGATLQLVLNVAALIVAGVATLVVQHALTNRDALRG